MQPERHDSVGHAEPPPMHLETSKTPEAPTRSEIRKVVLGGVAGQIVEWYDYALYGLLAVSIGKVFFTTADPAVGILAAFAVFGSANVMRPLGGLVLGPLGDRFGRRAILLTSVAGISIATFLVGVLPGMAAMGVAAPVLLVFLRLLQGFSAGGEAISVSTYVAEYSPVGRRGVLTAFLQSAATIAFLLASLLVLGLTSAMSPESFDSWGWRIPFLLALPLGIFSVWLRSHLDESPVFKKLRTEGEISKTPLRETLTSHPWLVVQGIGLVAMTFSAGFVFLSYFPTYLKSVGLDSQDAFLVVIAGLVVNIIAQPLIGALSDRFGRKATAIVTTLYFILGSWPIFAMMSSGSMPLAIIGLSLMAIGVAGSATVIICFFTEMTQARTRMATFAVGYNIGSAVFAGPALVIVQLLATKTGDLRSPSFYLVGGALMTLVTLLTIKSYSRPDQSIR